MAETYLKYVLKTCSFLILKCFPVWNTVKRFFVTKEYVNKNVNILA